MSTTFASGSSRTQKATCSKCKRTIYVVIVDGVRVETDPELINVVLLEAKTKTMARRIHGELCLKYQLDDERKAALRHARSSSPKHAPAMRWIDLASGARVDLSKAAKRPRPGKREPGQ